MASLPEEVIYVHELVLTVDRERVESLKAIALKNKRRRVRLCAHTDENSPVHEMLIVHLKGNYIPPHKHLGKAESMHVVEGEADLIYFDERGEIVRVVELGAQGSRRAFYCRTGEPLFHTLIVKSDVFVFHETAKGPYVRSETVFPDWAPHEDDIKAAKAYMAELTERKQLCQRQ